MIDIEKILEGDREEVKTAVNDHLHALKATHRMDWFAYSELHDIVIPLLDKYYDLMDSRRKRGNRMNKLDLYDANQIVKARELIDKVRDYNSNVQSSSLYRKLNTIIAKLDAILSTELEPELQEEYNRSGRIN